MPGEHEHDQSRDATPSSRVSTLLRSQLTTAEMMEKFVRNLSKDSSSRKQTRGYFEGRMSALREIYKRFHDTHKSILRFSRSEEPIRTEYWGKEIPDIFEETYMNAFAELRDMQFKFDQELKEREQSNLSNLNDTINDTLPLNTDHSLPEIKLPVFDGQFINWPAFKEIFLARIHKNALLSNLQKFYYLKGALNGDAAEDIQHISVIGDNYRVVWDMLLKQYENKRVLFSHYMDMFENQSSFSCEDHNSLRRFLQTIRSCLNAISSLGVNITDQTQILAFYIIRKLPKTIRNNWNRSLGSNQEIFTVDQVLHFLEESYQVMITSSTIRSTSSSSKSETNSNKSREFNAPKPKKDIKAFVTETKPKAKVFKCAICAAEHSIRECAQFLNTSVAERKNTVDRLKLCYNCLGFNHMLPKCTSIRNCLHCGGRHHSLLHFTSESSLNPNSRTFDPAIPSTSNSNPTAQVNVNVTRAIDNNVLLATAIVNVWSNHGEMFTARALIDQAANAKNIFTVQT